MEQLSYDELFAYYGGGTQEFLDGCKAFGRTLRKIDRAIASAVSTAADAVDDYLTDLSFQYYDSIADGTNCD